VIAFPKDFVWGAATSSYQIEGAAWEDGRGECIWDRFARTPGKVLDGLNGDVACDHYHRYRDDVALMKELGLQAYRFSIAWPRIFPTGSEAAPVEAGLDFYERLTDTLLEAGITPWVTLYHWDLPQALEDAGGWPNRRTVDAFVRLTDVVSRRLGDRVTHWITHNEPWCAARLGYETGIHAPGRTHVPDALAAAHHILLSHGRAVPVIRANSPGAQVGITLNLVPSEPASPSEADRKANQRFDAWFNRWFMDPLLGKGYPEDLLEEYVRDGHVSGMEPDFVQAGDYAAMAVECDFLGINYYSRGVLRAEIPEDENEPRTIPEATDEQKTDIGWEVYPDGLYQLLMRLKDDFGGLPIYITENGAAYHTGPSDDGVVRDRGRLAYLDGHLRACRRALDDGAPLAGYFAWSLMDNFEWQEGYTQRFGLVWIDYETQERVPKESARWYAEVIARNGLEDEPAGETTADEQRQG